MRSLTPMARDSNDPGMIPMSTLIVRRLSIGLIALLGVAASGVGPAHADYAQAPTVTGTISGVGNPSSLALTRDDAKLFVPSGATQVFIADTSTSGNVTGVATGNGPWAVAMTPDGQRAYITLRGEARVTWFDTQTNARSQTAISVGAQPESIAIAGTPNGVRAYVANRVLGLSNGSVSVIDLATSTVVATVTVGREPQGIAATTSGDKVYVTNAYSQSISVIDTATNAVSTISLPGGWPKGIAIAPDDSRAYVTDELGNQLFVINLPSGTVSQSTVTVGSIPSGLAVTPDGRYVYVANSNSGTVSVVDTQTLTVSSTVQVGTSPSAIAIGLDGRVAYVADRTSGTVSVIDTGWRATASGSDAPRVALQQFSVASGTEPSGCGALAPPAVDWPALTGQREVGWSITYAEWPNGGSGGWVCTRQPVWSVRGWVLN